MRKKLKNTGIFIHEGFSKDSMELRKLHREQVLKYQKKINK